MVLTTVARLGTARALPRSARAVQTLLTCSNGAMTRCFSSDASKDKILDQARKWQRQTPDARAKVLSVQIDRSGLKQPGAYPGRIASEEMLGKKTKENDLVHVIRTMIEVKGPLTVSEFMQRVRPRVLRSCSNCAFVARAVLTSLSCLQHVHRRSATRSTGTT